MSDDLSKNLVIDTGPLFLAVLAQYFHKTRPPQVIRDRLIRHATENDPSLRSARFFEDLRAYLGRRTLITTSYAVSELQGLLLRCDIDPFSDLHREFWALCGSCFRVEVQEISILLTDLYDRATGFAACAEQIGPTDAMLLMIAFREKAPLMTGDMRTLGQLAREFAVQILTPHAAHSG